MTISILTLEQTDTWQSYYENLPTTCTAVYFSPQYYQIFQKMGQGNACCFVLEEQGKFILYPFLIKPIRPLGYLETSQEFYDIEGAYGYNGAASNCNDAEFFYTFGTQFCDYAKSENIVAEFTRFNPTLQNQTKSQYMQIIHANDNVVLDLAGKNIWMEDYEHATRKNVNKAQRSGCSVTFYEGNSIPDQLFESFLSIYADTMTRNDAESYYFFSRSFFEMLQNDLDHNTLFFFTHKDSVPISAEIILYDSETAYSFLGGTLSPFFPLRPNDLLKHVIIQTLQERGVRYFCLGGGITKNDGIFKYKKTFAKSGVRNFYIGKKIHNNEAYATIVENWQQKNPDKAATHENFLLKYRL